MKIQARIDSVMETEYAVVYAGSYSNDRGTKDSGFVVIEFRCLKPKVLFQGDLFGADEMENIERGIVKFIMGSVTQTGTFDIEI